MGGFYVGECPRISPFLKNNGPLMESLDNRFTSQVDFNINKSRIAAIVMMRMCLSIIYLVSKTD